MDRSNNREPNGGDFGAMRHLFSTVLKGLLIAALSVVLFYVVSIYDDALRDPRFFDGWVLVAGIGLQLYFHIAVSGKILSPKASGRWRKLHILFGYLLIPAFLLHTDYSLPDTIFEWVLWACFILVAASGVFGVYITWSLRSRNAADGNTGLDRVPDRRAKLARDVHEIITSPHPAAAWRGLPAPPYDAWIGELYSDWLKDYLERQSSLADRLMGSHNRLKRVMSEIDHLSGYVDRPTQRKLAAVKTLVAEKDRLDATRVALGLSRGWLFIHVPATYMLIVLTVLHVLVAYAFSSGAW